jgi:hypothetical protein
MVGAFSFFLKLGFDFVFDKIFRIVHWVDVDKEPQRHDDGENPQSMDVTSCCLLYVRKYWLTWACLQITAP